MVIAGSKDEPQMQIDLKGVPHALLCWCGANYCMHCQLRQQHVLQNACLLASGMPAVEAALRCSAGS